MTPVVESGHARRIGDILLERHLVDEATVNRAVQLASEAGAKVGEVLIAMGAIDSKTLTSALANQWNLPFVTPSHFARAQTLPGSPDVEHVLADRWLPLRVNADGQVLVAVTDLPDDDLTEHVRAALGREPVFALADPWDFQRAVLDRFGAELVDRASFGLWGRSPDQSARVVLIRWQKVALAVGPPCSSHGGVVPAVVVRNRCLGLEFC